MFVLLWCMIPQTSPVQKARQMWMCTLPAALEVEQHSLIGGEAVMDPTVVEAFKTKPLEQSPEVQKKLQGFFPETWGFDYVEVVPSSSFEGSDGGMPSISPYPIGAAHEASLLDSKDQQKPGTTIQTVRTYTSPISLLSWRAS